MLLDHFKTRRLESSHDYVLAHSGLHMLYLAYTCHWINSFGISTLKESTIQHKGTDGQYNRARVKSRFMIFCYVITFTFGSIYLHS